MTIADFLMILAVLVSPVIAVQVQKAIERWKDGRNKKLFIFKTLMATRGARLSPAYVEALNMIDLEFNSRKQKEKKVLDAWKVYHDHLYDVPKDYNSAEYQARFEAWNAKTDDCQTELFVAMGQCLAYDFDRVQLKKGFYAPQGHADIELEQLLIRRGMVDLLYGKRSLPVDVGTHPIENRTRQSS